MHELYSSLTTLLLAQAEAAGEAPQGFLDQLRSSSLPPLLLMIGAMYFLMIRPMLKQNRQQQDLLKGLKKDDEVVTSGGMYGKIHSIDAAVVTLEVANGIRLKLLRSSIAGKWNPQAQTPAAAESAKSAKE